jgi:hypothetical protein
MRRFLVVIPVCAMLMAGFAATAQAQDGPGGSSPERSASCNPNLRFVYSVGTAKEWTVCLSSEGNVVQMIAPGGVGHQQGYEGYRVCSPVGTYFDQGFNGAGGWGAATVVQPGGPGNITGLTITRTSVDGHWLLTQKFAKDNNERDFTITMYLKKLNTPVAGPVYLQRWSVPSVDGDFNDDIADKSADSLWWREARAVTLTAATYATSHNIAVANYPFGAGDCTSAGIATPTSNATAVAPTGRVTYVLPGFNANKQVTVKYRWQAK